MKKEEFLRRFEKKQVEVFRNTSFENPLVSVCIVTYQHANYIRECLNGILMQQTTFPFEILLGDDASTDGTRETCIEYAQKHPTKIRLFLHHRENNIAINGSPTGRFNFLYNLYNASGKYIALCEGDDYWTDPLKLQKQVDFLEDNDEYNICFHKVKLYYNQNNIFTKDTITREVNETTDVIELSKGNFIHTPSIVFRNNYELSKWLVKCPTVDWALYMTIVNSNKIKKINEIMAIYRINDKGIWSGKNAIQQMLMTVNSFKIVYKNLDMNILAKKNLYFEIISLEKKIKINSKGKLKIGIKIKRFLRRILKFVFLKHI
tara:strand:- start:15993 stop:16949 length:957 start_codon:yes stop_codon:yes gene_type:complete